MKFGNLARFAYARKTIKPPYFHVAQIGDPVLRSRCEELSPEIIRAKEVRMLINHMISVMKDYSAAGLACNQIGMPYRIVTMEFPEKRKETYSPEEYERREMQTLPVTVMVNPVLKVTNEEKVTDFESCLSVKGYSGKVERFKGVSVEGFNENGEARMWNFSGWNARIAQHEIDHLDGVVYTDRMDPKTFHCTLWEAVNKHGGRIEMPFYKT